MKCHYEDNIIGKVGLFGLNDTICDNCGRVDVYLDVIGYYNGHAVDKEGDIYDLIIYLPRQCPSCGKLSWATSIPCVVNGQQYNHVPMENVNYANRD